MSWKIETPVRIGATAFAAISEMTLEVHGVGRSIVCMGERRPLLILHCAGDAVSAVDINGHGYEEAEIELLYPDAIAQLRTLLKDAP